MGVFSEIVFCDAFWQSLGDRRHESGYQELRADLMEFYRTKLTTGQRYGDDEPFGRGALREAKVWHYVRHDSANTAVFYVPKGDRLHMAYVGTVKDYAHGPEGKERDARLALKIDNTMRTCPAAPPGWKTFKWSQPEDIIDSLELSELSPVALDTLKRELEEEGHTNVRFNRLHGVKDACEVDEDVVWEYIRMLDCAKQMVEVTYRNGLKPTLPTKPPINFTRSEIYEAAKISPELRELLLVSDTFWSLKPDYDWHKLVDHAASKFGNEETFYRMFNIAMSAHPCYDTAGWQPKT